MKSLFEQMGGTYTKVGDYYLPNLLPDGKIVIPQNLIRIKQRMLLNV